jgi:hypothetical protein
MLQPCCVTLCLQLACFSFTSGHGLLYIFFWDTQLQFFPSESCAEIHLAANTCHSLWLQIFTTTGPNVTTHPALTPVARVISTNNWNIERISSFSIRNSCTCTCSSGNDEFLPCCNHDASHCANKWHAFLLPAAMYKCASWTRTCSHFLDTATSSKKSPLSSCIAITRRLCPSGPALKGHNSSQDHLRWHLHHHPLHTCIHMCSEMST